MMTEKVITLTLWHRVLVKEILLRVEENTALENRNLHLCDLLCIVYVCVCAPVVEDVVVCVMEYML